MGMAGCVDHLVFPSVLSADTSTSLIQSIRNGATDLFYELIRPHERNIYLTALAITGNHADAEEVVQESLLKAFRYLNQFRGESKFSTWLVRITVNEARGLLRKNRRVTFEPLEYELPSGHTLHRDFPDKRETPWQTLEREEQRLVVNKAVAMLPPKYREIFELRDLQKLSINQTAKHVGITRSTVKARLWRARLKLRRLIAGRLTYTRRKTSFAASNSSSRPN